MSAPTFQHLISRAEQGTLVLSIVDKEIQGDEIARALRSEMMAALEASGCQKVVVDFQKTQYLSSVAFWPLISLYRKLREIGGQLMICGLSQTIGDVFYTTRLVSRDGNFAAPFGLEKDVATALDRLAGSPSAGPG